MRRKGNAADCSVTSSGHTIVLVVPRLCPTDITKQSSVDISPVRPLSEFLKLSNCLHATDSRLPETVKFYHFQNIMRRLLHKDGAAATAPVRKLLQ